MKNIVRDSRGPLNWFLLSIFQPDGMPVAFSCCEAKGQKFWVSRWGTWLVAVSRSVSGSKRPKDVDEDAQYKHQPPTEWVNGPIKAEPNKCRQRILYIEPTPPGHFASPMVDVAIFALWSCGCCWCYDCCLSLAGGPWWNTGFLEVKILIENGALLNIQELISFQSSNSTNWI